MTLCRRHAADIGGGAQLQTATARTAAATVTRIQDANGNPAPWNHVNQAEAVAECRYRFPPGPGHPVIRCGPDVQQPPGSTTAYFYDAAGHRSVVVLNAAGGTQCTKGT